LKQSAEGIKSIGRRILIASAVIHVIICLGGCGSPVDSTAVIQKTVPGQIVEVEIDTAENNGTTDASTALSNIPNPANPTQPASLSTPLSSTDTQPNQTPPPSGDLATVSHIVDGDTIDVALDGRSYRVRYIGMDTPERGNYFFSEATEANRALVEGQQVILVKDVSETDRYGRLLRYIYLEDGTFVNAELVRQGYAVIATFPPDVRHQALFLELEREAREAGRGLWAQPVNTEPTPSEPQPTTVPAPTNVPAPASTNPPAPTNRPSQRNRPTVTRPTRLFVFPLPH
jgi:micrococcal nuclease